MMSLPSIQAVPSVPSQNAKPEIVRPKAAYHPSIWGDQFTDYDAEDDITHARMQQQVEELKAVVKREVFENKAIHDELSDQLKLIDAIQCLGVAYHFENEIEEALEDILTKYHDYDGDLYHTALGFRLLRQHGYNISSDIFNKFKDASSGSFKAAGLINDVSGMLSLYEASHFRLRGEDLLDEALVFTTTQLELVTKTNISDPLAAQITQSLHRPLRKDLERVCARRHMSIYKDEVSHNEDLLKLAKLDFNLVQSLHKKELSEIIKWYKEQDFARKMPFARDRIVELYFWIVGVYFEPQYSTARNILTKAIAILSVMDDTYDAFGSFEELETLTAAIQRWDATSTYNLPNCMQLFYDSTVNLLKEIEELMLKEGRSYGVHFVKESFKRVAGAYFEEAKWLKQDHLPSVEEYIRTATVSATYPLLAIVSVVGMGDIATEETFQWLSNDPQIVIASTTISRLMDDIVSSKFEKEREHVASSIDCYMKQYGMSEQEVIDVLSKQVADLWKDINQEFLKPTAVPKPVLLRVLNLAKVMDLLYKEDDGYTRVGKVMKEGIATHFIDPVPL